MAKYQVRFLDGPCSNRIRTVTMTDRPQALITCGGAIYAFRGMEGETLGGTFTGLLVYALSGGPYDPSAQRIAEERDVYRGWSKLRHALTKTTPKELRAVRRAGARVRRAVR